MSMSTHLVCKKCKKYIWIGQGDSIYTGEPETMELLKDFLQIHKTWSKDHEHELLFIPEVYNGQYEDDGYEQVEIVRSNP